MRIMRMWPRGEEANAAVCKTAIRRCKSDRGLRNFAAVLELVYRHGLKPCGVLLHVGSSPTRGIIRGG